VWLNLGLPCFVIVVINFIDIEDFLVIIIFHVLMVDFLIMKS